MIPFIIFILILSFLVLIHELGHFIAAKRNGILVEEFGFGLPPRIAAIKYGETLYSINLLPFGGFVKLFGEEEQEIAEKETNKEQLKRAFSRKKPLQKISVIVAGVFMNLMLGIVLYYVLLGKNGFVSEPLVLLKKHSFRFGITQTKPVFISIVKNSPAEKSGFKSGDVILSTTHLNSLNPQTVKSSEEFKKIIYDWYVTNQKAPLSIRVKNIYTNSESTRFVTPTYDHQLKRPVIGVGLQDIAYLDYSQNVADRMFSGIFHSYNVITYNYSAVFDLIKMSFREKNISPVADSVAGPVGIFSLVRDIIQTSGDKTLVNVLNVTAILSLSLAVMNILPFPALDGGRLLFVLYELVRRKRIHPKIEQSINMVGFAILIVLISLITLSDILKLLR